jgi:hypothetical protein
LLVFTVAFELAASAPAVNAVATIAAAAPSAAARTIRRRCFVWVSTSTSFVILLCRRYDARPFPDVELPLSDLRVQSAEPGGQDTLEALPRHCRDAVEVAVAVVAAPAPLTAE